MKEALILFFLLILVIFVIFNGFSNEGWYPTSTYVNTPKQFGVYYASPQKYDWRYQRAPIKNRITYSAMPNYSLPFSRPPASQVGVGPYLPLQPAYSTTPYPPNPYGNPTPLQPIFRGLFGPMLTSIKSPKDFLIGQWVKAGLGYTDNPNDFTYVDVYQLNLDPGRDLFSYMAKTKDGQFIPINLQQNHDRLEDGDRFKIQGMEGKGDFVFTEADKYQYVYR